MNNPIQKWARNLNRHLTKEDTEVTNKQMKRYSILYIIRELQIKTIIRYHYTHIPEKAVAPHSGTLPGKSHGWRSLVGCSPWGREESDTTKQLPFHFSLSCIGEGNGNPLQCSCLENPRDGGAWWAAIYGVAQSQTRLERLSSSSSRLTWPPQLCDLISKISSHCSLGTIQVCLLEFSPNKSSTFSLKNTCI